MQQTTMTRRLAVYAISVAFLSVLKPAAAADPTVSLRLSLGNSWQDRNDVQIPNSDLGTRFSLEEAAGSGPVPAARFEVNWAINHKHGIRVLLAPLSYTETVMFNQPVAFVGESFGTDQTTEATYRFNSWRLGYHYSLMQSDRASVKIGATLKVRDAEIRLKQGETESFDDDVGFVPLLYLAGSYQLSDRWTVRGDFDGLAGGPGRAIDLGVGLDYSIAKRWQIGAEVRVLDGGADTDDVYNFARFNTAAIAISTNY